MHFHQRLPKPNQSKAPPAFYRLRDVIRICALSRSTVYRRMAEGRVPNARATRRPSIRLAQRVAPGVDRRSRGLPGS